VPGRLTTAPKFFSVSSTVVIGSSSFRYPLGYRNAYAPGVVPKE